MPGAGAQPQYRQQLGSVRSALHRSVPASSIAAGSMGLPPFPEPASAAVNRCEDADGPHPQGAKQRPSGGCASERSAGGGGVAHGGAAHSRRRSQTDQAPRGCHPCATPAPPVPRSGSPERREAAPPAPRSGALPGLSPTHIPSHVDGSRAELVPLVTVYDGGRLVRLSHGKGPAPTLPPRSACGPFNGAMRLRLIRWVAGVDLEHQGPGTFVTLTMPGSWRPGCDTPRDWKRHLDVWLHRLKRRFPAAWGVWRLEPQRRGAPHYHLLLWGLPGGCSDWVARSWWEVVGSGEASHLRAGTRTEWMREAAGTMFYAAKYCAKVVPSWVKGWEAVGRWWGVHNRCEAVRKPETVRLGDREWCSLRRWLRRLVNGPGRRRRVRCDGSTLDPLQPHRVGVHALVKSSTVKRLLEYLNGR